MLTISLDLNQNEKPIIMKNQKITINADGYMLLAPMLEKI